MRHRTVCLRSSSQHIPYIFTMPFPQSLTTTPFGHSRTGWFDICSCKPISGGLLPSLIQHRRLTPAFVTHEDLLPTRSEAQCCFFPGQLTRPLRQEDHVSAGERVLAVRPRQRFDLHATGTTIDASHGIEQKHRKAPDGNKLEAALCERVVTPRRLVTA